MRRLANRPDNRPNRSRGSRNLPRNFSRNVSRRHVIYDPPLNVMLEGEEGLSIRQRALRRQGLPTNEEELIALRQLDFQQSVLGHLSEMRPLIAETHNNTRDTITRLVMLKDQVQEVGDRISREIRGIRTRSRCRPTDPRTWHHCVKLYYKLLYTLFVTMAHTLHIICESMRSFGHALILPFSVVCVLIVWIGQILILIGISDGTIRVGTFGQTKFIDVFRFVFHGVYLFGSTILYTTYKTFGPYYKNMLTEMGQVMNDDIHFRNSALALRQRGVAQISTVRNETEIKVRQIIADEVGGLVNKTGELPGMIYNASINATMNAGAAVAGAAVASASAVVDTVGTALGTAVETLGSTVETAVGTVGTTLGTAVETVGTTGSLVGKKIGNVASSVYDVIPSISNVQTKGSAVASSVYDAIPSRDVIRDQASAAASAAAERASIIYDAIPSGDVIKDQASAAKLMAAEAAEAARKSGAAAWSKASSYFTQKKTGGSRKTKKVKSFTLLHKSEKRSFNKTYLGKKIIEMKDIIDNVSYIPMNEEMYYNMSLVLEIVDVFLPFLISGLSKSIDVCKLIHKYKINVKEDNMLLIESLKMITL